MAFENVIWKKNADTIMLMIRVRRAAIMPFILNTVRPKRKNMTGRAATKADKYVLFNGL
jgi:hypothetical protein